MDATGHINSLRLLRTSRAVERVEDYLSGGSSNLRMVVALSALFGGLFGGALGALIILGVK